MWAADIFTLHSSNKLHLTSNKSANNLNDSEESDKMCSSQIFNTIKSLLILHVHFTDHNLSNCLILYSVCCVNFSPPLCFFSAQSGLTPIHVAAFMGHDNIVHQLINHGASPNTSNVVSSGSSSLSHSVSRPSHTFL